MPHFTDPVPVAPMVRRAEPAFEREWIARTRDGDEVAFGEMFAAYYQPLCRFAAGIVGGGDAEDVVQGTFVAIWQLGQRWQVRGPLRVYLYTAVRNRAVQHVRKCRTRDRLRALNFNRRGENYDRLASPSADRTLQHDELAAAIERAIEALPPRARQAFRLQREHGLTYDEIARVMGISPKTVNIHIGRALVALRKSLADCIAPMIALVVLR